MHSRKFILTILSLILIFLLNGCIEKIQNVSISPVISKNDDYENLINNYQYYWYNYSKNNWKETYELELPYQQYFFSFNRYENHFSTAKKDFNITAVSITEKNRNIVYIDTQYTDKFMTSNLFRDKWIKINEQWYHKFHTSTFPNSDY